MVALALAGALGIGGTIVGFDVAQAQEAPFQASIDFGASNTTTPAGSVRDVGSPFAARNGLVFGWVDTADGTTPIDIRGVGRRRVATTPLSGSIIHMGSADLVDINGVQTGVTCSDSPKSSLCNAANKLIQNAIWEIAVPNGTYDVTLGAGDPSGGNDAEEHDIAIEGVLIADGPRLAGEPATSANGVNEYTGTVNVDDGLLTMTQGPDGFNAKPAYISVVEQVAAPAGPDTPADFTATTGATLGTAELGWTASADAVDYDVLRDGAVVATVAATSYTDGPIASGTYSYAVVAKNAAGQSAPTADIAVDVTYAQCNDISTLACDDVTVALPYPLDFTADAGGLGDNVGVGTGFTMVDPPSARLAVDNPVFDPGVPGYEPSNLTVDTAEGQLEIVSTKGIAYRNPAASSETNSQINTLGVGVDPTDGLIISTTLDSANFNDSAGNNSQQTGIWFGLNEAEFVKLVVGKQSSQARVQLVVEMNDGAAATDYPEINSPNFDFTGPIELELTVDPTTNTVSGTYSLDGAAPVSVDDGTNSSLPIPAATATLDAPAPFAGLFATQRRAAAAATFTSAYSSFNVTAFADTTAPEVPENLVAVAGDAAVALDWDDVADAAGDLAGYNVYVDGVQNNTTPVTASDYSVTGLTNGNPYSFTVTSVDTTGNESAASLQALATPVAAADTTAPEVPANVTAVAGDATVAVGWDAVADAAGDLAGYNVFVDDVQANTALVTGTSFDATGLTNGTEYSFTVTSVDTTGNESAASAAVTATPVAAADTTAPEVPANVTAVAGDATVAVGWDAVADAAGDLAGYNVFVDDVQANTALVTGTSFDATGLTNGTEYSFTVTSVDTTGNESAASAAVTATPVAAAELSTAPDDFDGDGVSDIAVFRNGSWYVLRSGGGFTSNRWGTTGDVPVAADYDGDGRADLAVFRNGSWYVLRSSGGFTSNRWGTTGDVPVVADYDGDGRADLAVFRNGSWYVQKSTGGFVSSRWGAAGDVPVVADYDGDGLADLAVFRSGTWYIKNSSGGTTTKAKGSSGDTPVVGDYDGDGLADVAVFRSGSWLTTGSTSGANTQTWGRSGDIPVVGDYNGDGTTDLTVFRNGSWYSKFSGGGSRSTNWGATGDIAIGGKYNSDGAVQGTLTATPTSVAFDIDEDETDSQNVTITGNQATPNATANESADWLTVTKGAGNVFTFTADGSTVAPASYTTTVTFSAPGYADRTVSVTLVVNEVVVPNGTLTADPTSVESTVIEGNSDSASVTVTGDGDTPVLSADESADWLNVTDETGGVFTFDIDSDGLAVDTYSTDVTFTAPGYDPVVVTVTLTVEALGTLTADPDAVDFTIEEGGTDSTVVTVVGDGETPVLTASESADWLTVVDDTAGVFDFAVDTAGLAVDTYTTDVLFSAPDYNDVTVTVTLEVTAAVPTCSPVSTLPCDEISVALPFDADFGGTGGGLDDADGDDIAFTMAQVPSNKETGDPDPTVADVPGYVASRLDVAGDALTIGATNGLAFRQLAPAIPNSTNVNSQQNTLGVGFDADAGPFTIQTTVDVDFPGNNNFQQAGLWFGLDEDNYVKLVARETNNVNTMTVELLREVGADDAGSSVLTGSLAEGPITLTLDIDPGTGSIVGSYLLDGATTPVEVATLAATPQSFFDGAALPDDSANVSFGGVFTSARRATVANRIDATFSAFSIDGDTPTGGNNAPEVLLTGDRTLFNDQDTIIPVNTFDDDGDPVTIEVTGLPSGLIFDGDDITGTVAPDADSGSPYTVDVTGDDGIDTTTESFTITVIPAVDVQVNFQAQGTTAAPVPVPSGYLKDFGEAFGERSGTSQGTGLSYGWVAEGTNTPLSLVGNGRDRNRSGIDQRLDTFIHVQYGDIGTVFGGTPNCTTNVCPSGGWEIAVPNGLYDVTVTVGDQPSQGVYDSRHAINVETGLAILEFQADANNEYLEATAQAGVIDGRLSISAIGGANTKINSVRIRSVGTQPIATQMIPPNRSTDIGIGNAVSVSVEVPGTGVGVDPDRATSLTDDAVKLFKLTPTGEVEVAGNRGSTGGNDTIAFSAQPSLEYDTTYRYVIDGVLDEAGQTFGRFESTFRTEEEPDDPDPAVCAANPALPQCQFDPVTEANFEKVLLPTASDDNGKYFASLVVHDGHLWGTTVGQGIYRYEILDDGTLGPEQDLNIFKGRAVIGLVFDEDVPTRAWVTNATANTSNESARIGSKVSIIDFSNVNAPVVTDVIINLPRSQKDHLSNSIAYGPDGDLYFLQGSNQAAGDTDSAWGDRGETQLTAALLHFDPAAVLAQVAANGPIDVATQEVGGSYDPFAPGAPLKIYATGIRNAFDLVWHSNGHIYVPTNGTASGGSSPGVTINGGTATMRSNDSRNAQTGFDQGTDVTDVCNTRRIDGQPYTGGDVAPATSHPTQLDYLFDVEENGYYGHPNPTRCEWVLNGGSASPQNTGSKYPANTEPDPNYRGFAYNFDFNKSPNGAIEYKSQTFGGELVGRLMVVRFSNNDDILTMQVSPDGDVLGAQPGTDIPGFSGGYADPLEMIEDTEVNPGNIYINQYNRAGQPQQLFLLRVPEGEQAAQIEVDSNQKLPTTDALVMSATLNNEGPTDTHTVTVSNGGADDVVVTGSIAGANASQFSLEAVGSIPAGGSVDVDVTFDPTGTTVGTRTATLAFATPDGTVTLDVRALAHAGREGSEEPSLQQVFDTLETGLTSGWSGLAGGTNPAPVGDEVDLDLFERASDGPVIVTPVAAFAPFEDLPFGWYPESDGAATYNGLGVLPNGQQQTLVPDSNPAAPLEFDPGTGAFGFYYDSNTFGRKGFTEDARNLQEPSNQGVSHRARVYPLSGNAFYVAFEDAANGDYQDYDFILENVVAAGTNPDPDPDPDPEPTGDTVKINFQSETAPTPAGYLADWGQPYGARTGTNQGQDLTYGWVEQANPASPISLVGNGRDRNLNSDQLLDTLMHMQLPVQSDGGNQSEGTWQLAVENGQYEVTVAVGDPQDGGAPETHTVNVEGTVVVDAFPKSTAANGSAARHTTGTAIAEVTDGQLTVDALGGTNTKINWLEMTPLSTSGQTVAQVNFQPAGSPTPTDWVADSGQLFDAGRGYGWVRTEGGATKVADTRDRTQDTDLLDGTIMIVDDSQVPAVVDGEWEYALANGTYDVTVSVGDPGFADSTHGISAEGTSLVSGFVPAAAGGYQVGSALVEVTDGRLTLASTGSNTKIQWVTIESTGGGDVVAPQVSIGLAGPGSGNAYTGPVTVSITINDSSLEFVEVSVDGVQDTSINAQTYGTPFEVSGNGNHIVEVIATDGGGNSTTKTAEFSILEPNDGELTLTNPEAAPFNDRLVMSRIQSPNSSPMTNQTATVKLGNAGTEPLLITALGIANPNDFELVAPPTLPLTIAVGASVDVQVLFDGVGTGRNRLFESTLNVTHDGTNGPTTAVELAGQWQTQSEGGNEPNVAQIVDAFGFGTTIVGPGQQLNNQGRLEAIGDEVLSRTWKRANTSAPITVRQLAAYHSCCSNTASFKWHQVGNKGAQTSVLTHNGQWAQTLLPRRNGSSTLPATASFTPGPAEFSLSIDPESSDWTLNNSGPDNCGSGNAGCQLGHHLRLWPSEDRDGNRIADQWIVVMDYSGINYDFNDNVYLVDNLRPASAVVAGPPAAPTGLTAALDGSSVSLDWNDNADFDLDGYAVERSVEGAAFVRIATDLTSSVYQDSGAPADSEIAYRVIAMDNADEESAPSATATVQTPVFVGPTQRVNAGGPAVTTGGNLWSASQFLTGGKTYEKSGLAIAGTTDDIIYRTEYSTATGSMSADVPVTNGTYEVRLHFAEIYFGVAGGGPGGAGKRVFDVSVEGNLVLDDYDIIADVGSATAAVKSFTVNVTDGNIDLDFVSVVNQAKISAFEIVPVAGG